MTWMSAFRGFMATVMRLKKNPLLEMQYQIGYF